MGLFLANHENYDAYVERRSRNGAYTNAQNTYNTGNTDWAAYGIMGGVSIFGALLNKIGSNSDGQGEGDDDDVIDDETQKQIEAKKNELNQLYSENDVTSGKELIKATKAQQEKIDNLNTILGGQKRVSESLSTDLKNLETQKTSITTRISVLENTPVEERGTNYQTELSDLKRALQDINNKIGEKNKEIIEQDTKIQSTEVDLRAATNILAIYNTSIGRAENIEQEIRQLKGKKLPKEVTYDVKQETTDLKRFNEVLKNFPIQPKQEDVDKIITAFNSQAGNSESQVNQKHAIEAIKILKNKYSNSNLDWKALNVK